MSSGFGSPEFAVRRMQKGEGDTTSRFLKPTPDDVPIEGHQEDTSPDPLSMDPERSEMINLTDAEDGDAQDQAIAAASQFAGSVSVPGVIRRPVSEVGAEIYLG